MTRAAIISIIGYVFDESYVPNRHHGAEIAKLAGVLSYSVRPGPRDVRHRIRAQERFLSRPPSASLVSLEWSYYSFADYSGCV